MQRVTMIVLAAGKSTRMGQDKLLLPFGSGTVISTVLEAVVSSGFSRVVLVTSKETAINLKGLPKIVEVVLNHSPELGQAHSMLLGIKRIHELGGSFGIVMGDMPLLTRRDISAIFDAFRLRSPGKTAVIPELNGRFGHPGFFEPVWLDRFMSIKGDVGGRHVIRDHMEEVVLVKGTIGCFLDIDTPEDYVKALRLYREGGGVL
ncbi:MAG TPA: hypothetical protein DEQ04_04035 [Thermovirga lienii]|nr:hypothetical protein [Thermovirga lienii]